MMDIQRIRGKDLSPAIIQQMNQQRIHEYGKNTKNFRQYERESLFFFLRDGDHDDGQIRAWGMLKPVTITYQGRIYNILGIGNIIAVDKGQGYGKQLMTAIKAYLHEHKTIGLGFCAPEVSPFYVRCGYHVVEGLAGRFRYQHAAFTGLRERLEPTLEVLCTDPHDEDAWPAYLLRNHAEILINVPFW